MNKKTITKGPVRGVRFDNFIDICIQLIADYEDRSISYTISSLVCLSIWTYLDKLSSNDKNFEKKLYEIINVEHQKTKQKVEELIKSPDDLKIFIKEVKDEISQLAKAKVKEPPLLLLSKTLMSIIMSIHED